MDRRLKKIMERSARAVRNVAGRGVVKLVNAAAKCQVLQIEMLGGEIKDGIEHIEPYGFTAHPHAGAEAIPIFFDGDKSHGVIIAVADRRYRILGLKAGEVAIYSDEGDKVILRRGRNIHVETVTLTVEASKQATFDTPLLKCTGDIEDRTGSMQRMRDQHNEHDHNGDSGGITGKPLKKME